MLLRLFQFPYQVMGQAKVAKITVENKWVAMYPILSALGIESSRAAPVLKSYPHEMIVFPETRGRATLCLQTESIAHWLGSLNRYRDKERLRHFQQHLIPALNQFTEESKQPELTQNAQRVQSETDFQAAYVDEETAQKFIAQHQGVIYLNRALEPEDRLRMLINQLGVTDWDDVNYLAVTFAGLVLHRLPKTNAPEPYETWRPYIVDAISRPAKHYLNNGWDIAPIFFMKYPYLYQQQWDTYVTVDANKTKRVVARGPKGAAPWYTDKFAQRITARRHLFLESEKQEQQRQADAIRKQMRLYFEQQAQGKVEHGIVC